MNCLIWKMIATAYIWQFFDSSSTLNIDIYSSVTLLASNLLRSAKAHLWGKYIKESSPDWSTYIAVSFMPESSRNLLTCQSLPFFPLNCWSNWFDFRKTGLIWKYLQLIRKYIETTTFCKRFSLPPPSINVDGSRNYTKRILQTNYSRHWYRGRKWGS